ncbi:MAG: hypothetical protein J6Q76_01435 [Clostridia bacterium]|nr:hypothetical protein [Clostridia bacterium]MBO5912115.1 hypothetical protein [Clostridia bacterium]
MIKILPINSSEDLKKLYSDSNIELLSSSAAVVATDGDETIGYCLFYIDDKSMTVTALQPLSDLFLADGILRSALHVGVERGVDKAFYSNSAPIGVFEKLRFIKNDENNELDINKLFSSCQNCGNT